LARLSTRRARAGSALAELYQRASTLPAVQDGAMGDREGGEGGKATGRGRIAGGEENGGEAAVIPLLVGLQRRWTKRMRMAVAADGAKKQPTP
jgi:hypothetical protein